MGWLRPQLNLAAWQTIGATQHLYRDAKGNLHENQISARMATRSQAAAELFHCLTEPISNADIERAALLARYLADDLVQA